MCSILVTIILIGKMTGRVVTNVNGNYLLGCLFLDLATINIYLIIKDLI